MPLGPGIRLGPYEIGAPLGAGGMGEVYRARDTRLKREVAIKILRAGTGGDDAALLRRLEQEARTLAALNHPNLIAIHDIGEHEGSIFLVMELLEGETLRALLRQGALPPRRALECARQIAQGLAAAHAAGIAHRDLKPENIMFSADGRVKILDFGLARTVVGAGDDAETLTSPLTTAGAVMGTMGYMAPEQVRGEAADARSDIFAFGAIVYEMLAGKRAFQASTAAETMSAILRDEPAEITAGGAALAPAISRIVRRCLEKNPRQRFQSAADLDFALAALTEGSSTAWSAPAAAPATRARRNWRTPAWIAIAVLITTGVCALFMLDRGVPAISPGAYRPLTLHALGAGFFPVWSADGQALAYAALAGGVGVGQVYTYRLGDPAPEQLTHTARGSIPLAWSSGDRRVIFVANAMNAPSVWSVAAVGGQPQLLLKLPAPGSGAAGYAVHGDVLAALLPQPDGKLNVAYSQPIGAPLRWYEPAPFAVAGLSDFPSIAFSPNGSKLLLSLPDAQGPVRTWILPFPPAKARPPRPVLEDLPSRDFSRMTWMPDGRHILISAVFLAGGSKLWEADPASGRLRMLAQAIPGGYMAALSPAGDTLALTRFFLRFNIVSANVHTAAVRPLIASAHNQSMPAWAQDAPVLAYVSDRSGEDAIWIHQQTASGTTDRELIGPEQMGTGEYQLPALSPHAQRIAFTFLPSAHGGQPQPDRLWLASVAGGPAVPLTAKASDFQVAACWSPDGSQIAYISTAGPTNRLVTVATTGGATPRVLVPEIAATTATGSGPAWSWDGKWIAYGANDGFVHVIRPDGSGDHIAAHVPVAAWTFSADSKSLYGVEESGNTGELVSVALATGSVSKIGGLGAYVPRAWIEPGIHLTLSPDGQGVTFSTGNSENDLDLIQHFNLYGTGVARIRYWLHLP